MVRDAQSLTSRTASCAVYQNEKPAADSSIYIFDTRVIRLPRRFTDKRGELWMICEYTNHRDGFYNCDSSLIIL
jgi:hypothetical protein